MVFAFHNYLYVNNKSPGFCIKWILFFYAFLSGKSKWAIFLSLMKRGCVSRLLARLFECVRCLLLYFELVTLITSFKYILSLKIKNLVGEHPQNT